MPSHRDDGYTWALQSMSMDASSLVEYKGKLSWDVSMEPCIIALWLILFMQRTCPIAGLELSIKSQTFCILEMLG